MKTNITSLCILAVNLIMCGLHSRSTVADIIVTYEQNGPDILYKWDGSLDSVALGVPVFSNLNFVWNAHSPASGGVGLDTRVALYGLSQYDGWTVTPASGDFTFGTATAFDQTGNIKTGDDFAIETLSGGTDRVFLAHNYAGENISGTLTVTGHTLIGDGIFSNTVDLGSVGKIIITAAPDLEGDLNRDGFVDGADAGIMFSNWGPTTLGYWEGDLNRDALIDAADAGIMFGNWTGDVGPAVTFIPEPSSLLLVGLAGLIFGSSRRRR